MEGFNESISGFEKIKPKYHYTYTDKRILGTPKLHEFDASDDIEADDLFRQYIIENGIDISESEIVRGRINNKTRN